MFLIGFTKKVKI